MFLNRFTSSANARLYYKTSNPVPFGTKVSRRTLVSQTLLSRTDFERKTINELKEELKKRGIATGSKLKSKSSIISKILMDEEHRSTGLPNPPQTRSISNKKTTPSDANAGPANVKISSPAPVVARITEEVEKETPVLAKVDNTEETAGTSSALASPVSNQKSQGHQAETWPASVNLPITPVEELEGTAIPFIPDNYNSHRQSHAPQLTEVKGTTAGLEFSTASHPSTLPEGGPSLAAVSQSDSSSPTHGKQVSGTAFTPDNVSDMAQKLRDLWPTSLSVSKSPSSKHQIFEPEDRPLSDEERGGLYKLIGLVSLGWLLGGVFGPP